MKSITDSNMLPDANKNYSGEAILNPILKKIWNVHEMIIIAVE